MKIQLGLMLCLAAVPALAQPAPPAQPVQQFDVPVSGAPQSVAILTRDFAPGQSAGRHTHPGVEMTIVLHGDMELRVDGAPMRTLHDGDSFIVPRGAVHDIKNVGTAAAALAITYVTDKGAPLRGPAP